MTNPVTPASKPQTQNTNAEVVPRQADTRAPDRGTTTIADTVVQKIAGLATREVAGVHALGGGAARALSALRERIPGATASAGQGVSVEVGERQAAVDLNILVEYGVSIADLARSVRRNVIGAVEQMTGLEVVEVNVAVTDVHIPDDDEGAGATVVRVQ
ncbi:Asp23/Gls24 family envelope stress response protein [Actinokineospora auranticolor]|uniref:Putative alkaline shock family protein YloU n=1 Tax=Actinokineospora auranticolor TaxID=155976 RepID=A0A2S6GIP2_9PSEU|nr:Asp23/Gls24 family envelope stress response protein [Actinokineospora auranticolor]PPK65108.1 putative alkaline shock family protein YloU [Actinokineospora auranticolor]